jgi:cystathionine gamma-synthase
VNKGYDYARVSNPTRTALEECLASLENAAHGHAFASGVGATSTIMHLIDPGDRVVCVNDVYGGTYRMFSQVYEPKGYRFSYVTPDELSTEAAANVEGARLVWVESPTNPLLNVVDIAAVARSAKDVGALLVVDNTFATPYLQTPLDLGADIVLHSTTKYLGGHSDVVGGFAGTNDPTIAERLRFLQKSLGAVPGPFDSWLVLRGLKTLAVRMERHCYNARVVAAFLQAHPRVTQVLWPGLPEHPGHELAARQMRDFGGMMSFLVESEEDAVDLVSHTEVWTLAESLGGVESLIEHPARMTHASTATGPFAAPANLVRLSVGIESAEDLVVDLDRALAAARARA